MEPTTQSPACSAASRERSAREPHQAITFHRTGLPHSSPAHRQSRLPHRHHHRRDRAAGGGIFVYRYVTSYESTDDAQVDGHINSISTRISGHVIKLNVQDNQYVEAGTVLVEIDPADYQVAYDRAKADFEDAQAAASRCRRQCPHHFSQHH